MTLFDVATSHFLEYKRRKLLPETNTMKRIEERNDFFFLVFFFYSAMGGDGFDSQLRDRFVEHAYERELPWYFQRRHECVYLSNV